jgi:hypothetical protein
MSPSEPGVDPIDPTTRYEHRDINTKMVALTGAGVLVGMWLAVVLIYPFFRFLMREVQPAVPPALAQPVFVLPPAPTLQQNPTLDLRSLRAQENAALSSYKWVDAAKGVVSIPIERAIQLTAQRGIPPQPGPHDMTYFDPQAGTRLTGFEGKVAPEPR